MPPCNCCSQVGRASGQRTVFDEGGQAMDPLALLASDQLGAVERAWGGVGTSRCEAGVRPRSGGQGPSPWVAELCARRAGRMRGRGWWWELSIFLTHACSAIRGFAATASSTVHAPKHYKYWRVLCRLSCVPHVLDWLDGGLDMGMSHGGVWCACQPFSDGPPNSPYSDLNSLYPYSYPNSPYP